MFRHPLATALLPLAVIGLLSAHLAEGRTGEGNAGAHVSFTVQDTVIYSTDGYRRWWTEEDYLIHGGKFAQADSLMGDGSSYYFDIADGGRPAAMDTITAPDSLRLLDPFLFEFYPAVKDSLCHLYVKDSLVAMGDSLKWPVVDSLYFADSAVRAREAFALWYASLDKFARKRYDAEQRSARLKAVADSVAFIKDSLQAIRDSTIENTPRVLYTYILPDSLKYKRIVSWTHERDFHNLTMRGEDTTLNYRFYDYPFLRQGVNASWLGIAGSPVQDFDYSKRTSAENVIFYEALESWSYNPATLPMYNTKTPYTELGYSGGIFGTNQKVEENVHVLTTQNILPSWNVMITFDRFGAKGILDREDTKNKNFAFGTNYLGKKYLMHAGYIYNTVIRQENGGLVHNSQIEDVSSDVDTKGLDISLISAESSVRKHSAFIDQQFRIPFYFMQKWFKRKDVTDTLAVSDSVSAATADTATVIRDENVTTAFIGHSSEFSTYRRIYDDKISDEPGRAFYNDRFYYDPVNSHDSLRTLRLENKLFVRLQPWAQEAVVSKLDVGIGDRLTTYAKPEPSYLHTPGSDRWNTVYLYAGVDGKIKKYVSWNATGHYSLLGTEAGDFDVSANGVFSVYPFRRHRESPINLTVNFKTSLTEPGYYVQHLHTNHYLWDNEFKKISDTRIKGSLGIPLWKLNLSAAYGLLGNGIYFDEEGIVRQSDRVANVLSLEFDKEFVLWRFHLDHRLLFQMSSDKTVANVPAFSANLRYYIQLPIGKGAMDMQIGANAWYNTPWYAPGWNPVLGVFHNQNEREYGNFPFVDAFVNMRWQRAIIFLKVENVLMGVPSRSFFGADHYLRTTRAFKIGIFWPFYLQPGKNHSHSSRNGADGQKPVQR